MFRQKWIALLLGLALAPGAFAAPWDFSVAMTSFGNTVSALAGDDSFLNPDLNTNGILDTVEMALIEELVDDGHPAAAAITATMTANIAAFTTDFGATGVALFPTGPTVLAGYATLGGDANWGVAAATLGAGSQFGANTMPNRANYDESQSTVVGPCADADGDGVDNVNEFWGGAQTEAAYRAAANNAGATASGYDHYGSCGNFGFLKQNVYDTNTGIVYGYVAGDITFNNAETAAASVTIGGIPVEGGVLAKIPSGAINAALYALVSEDTWIGATDRVVEGEWRWLADGTQFWQGTTTGSAVGGSYENWRRNPGLSEPNNSGGDPGEDAAHMRGGDGMWNDANVTSVQEGFFYQLADTYADDNSDGIPDAFLDADLNGVPDGLGNVVVVQGPGASDSASVYVGGTVQLTAISDVGDTHNWSSANTAVATVSGSGLVTGVSAGTVQINASVATGTGVGNYVAGKINVTVTVPQWFEVCTLDDTFATQFSNLQGFGFDDDNELGTGDGVPDAWQLHLLAYALCVDSAKSLDDVSEATAAYNANLALIPAWIGSISANYVPRVQGLVASGAAIATLQAKFDGGSAAACDGALSGLGVPSIGDVLQDVIDASGDLFLLSIADGLIGAQAQALAGMATTSTELGLTLNAGLDDLLRDNINPILQLLGVIATPAMFGGLAGACPGSPETEALAILTASGYSIPADSALLTGGSAISGASLGFPSWAALQDSAKTAGEPLAGAGDYDGDGLTNAAVAAIVAGQGGDEDDFVVAASGAFGPFWEGNPALPVGSMVTLGALFSAMGAAGAMVLRRKK